MEADGGSCVVENEPAAVIFAWRDADGPKEGEGAEERGWSEEREIRSEGSSAIG